MATTNGYPLKNPKGAKPMSDPQLDMRTWKPRANVNPAKPNTHFTPEQLKRYHSGKSKFA